MRRQSTQNEIMSLIQPARLTCKACTAGSDTFEREISVRQRLFLSFTGFTGDARCILGCKIEVEHLEQEYILPLSGKLARLRDITSYLGTLTETLTNDTDLLTEKMQLLRSSWGRKEKSGSNWLRMPTSKLPVLASIGRFLAAKCRIQIVVQL